MPVIWLYLFPLSTSYLKPACRRQSVSCVSAFHDTAAPRLAAINNVFRGRACVHLPRDRMSLRSCSTAEGPSSVYFSPLEPAVPPHAHIHKH